MNAQEMFRSWPSGKLALVAEAMRSEAGLVRHEPIAIVGLDCRFPGGEDPDAFWNLLAAGRCAVAPVPPDRWDAEALFSADYLVPGTVATRSGNFLKDVRGFDAAMFKITGREASVMDPQQRILLETVWRALEGGAIAPDSLGGSRTGIFVGLNANDYGARILRAGDNTILDGHTGSGNSIAFAAGRIAYVLGTTGPAATLDTACSSGLLAIHQACQALHAGDCELAIAGGVHLTLSPYEPIYLSRTGVIAPDGRCKPFAAEADGFGLGEGCAVFVLTRLSNALRKRYAIAALIRGSAVSHDGASSGLTVPNGQAQQQVIRLALEAACLQPSDIDYIEAQATGTPLADLIELNALEAVFENSRCGLDKLLVGSVKANVGHTEAAAGPCGLAKVVQALQRETIPPQPPIDALNQHVNWQALDIEVVRGPRAWPRQQRPRRAGISAFGMSGTNVHVIVEEAPQLPPERVDADRPCHLYSLSAPDLPRLRALADLAASAVMQAPDTALADICYAANTGRARHRHRAALVVDHHQALYRGLKALATGTACKELIEDGHQRAKAGIVFMIGGQGSAYTGMSLDLYQTSPSFRRSIDLCAAALEPVLDVALTTILYDCEQSAGLLAQTRYAQPALAAVNWSLAQLWKSWGIVPAALVGHSLGEYVAAALAGMIEVEAMLVLVAKRGALMQQVSNGGMIAIHAAAAEVEDILTRHPEIALAAENASRRMVLAGPHPALDALRRTLEARGIASRPLNIDAAFHSAMMEPILPELEALVRDAAFAVPHTPIISNVSGAFFAADAPPPPSYWSQHARGPVRFLSGLQRLWDRGHRVFIDIGPRPVLSLFGTADFGKDGCFVASLDDGSEWQTLLRAAGLLWSEGAAIDWQAFDRDYPRQCLFQPPGIFLRKPYWFAEKPLISPECQTLAKPRAPFPEKAALMQNHDSLNVARIRDELRQQIAAALGEPPDTIHDTSSFAELGADSIMLAGAARAVTAQYGVKLTMRDFLGECGTLHGLASEIVRQRQSSQPAIPAAAQAEPILPAKPDTLAFSDIATNASDEISGLMRRQLDLVERVVNEQLATLSRLQPAGAAERQLPGRAVSLKAKYTASGATKPADHSGSAPEEDPRRELHRSALIAAYNRKTAKSKQLAELRRPYFADVRGSAGFRASIKEMIYPITGARADGARLWDVDGNEYIDISMDFGASLFGHRAPHIVEAMKTQLDIGLALGPRSPLASDVAALICELTGMDRVLFCQSGTESVMTALRLARLMRGRSKVALFRNSYHGHFDGVLGERDPAGGYGAIPAAPGILPAFTDDLFILDYGSEEALDFIDTHANDLAAVLVEPVQSRALSLQPKEFLHALRARTEQHGILLIFDEMISGFRIHPGGAQAYFGVRADITTYGKTLGGGVPMAAVAVRGDLLKGIDGGLWHYGDSSQPFPETTFFAGTFNNHPLGLAAAKAFLGELKRQGPALQRALNAKTASLTDKLNVHLNEAGVPLSMSRFGSVFRFVHKGNLDLLYFHLLHRGIFVWEGRNCFLSTAHSDDDVAAITEAVLASAAALQDGGFLSGRPLSRPHAAVIALAPTGSLALSQTQRQIWAASQSQSAGALAYVEVQVIELSGALDTTALQRAIDDLVARHEALRTTISDGLQTVAAAATIALQHKIIAGNTPGERDGQISAFARMPFDLSCEFPLRCAILEESNEHHILVMVAHHVLIDGLSIKLLMQELAAFYVQHTGGPIAALAPYPAQLGDYLRRLQRLSGDSQLHERQKWWQDRLQDPPPPVPLPPSGPAPDTSRRPGGRVRLDLTEPARASLQALARRHGNTLFSTALATTLGYIHRLYDRQDVLIGIGGSGRTDEEAGLVAQAAVLLPVRSILSPTSSIDDLAQFVAQDVIALSEKQTGIETGPLLEPVLSPAGLRSGALNVTFNLDRIDTLLPMAGITLRLLESPPLGAKFDLCINLTVTRTAWWIDFDYDADAFSHASIRRFAERWMRWVEGASSASTQPVMDVAIFDAVDAQLETAASLVDRDASSSASIAARIAAQALRAPDAVAIESAGTALTYRQIDRMARKIAARLREVEGLQPGSPVACIFSDTPSVLLAALGVVYAGAACLPLDVVDAPSRWEEIIGQYRPVCALTDHVHAAMLSGLGVITITDALDSEVIPLETLPSTAGTEIAWIATDDRRQSTVEFSYGRLHDAICWMARTLPLETDEGLWLASSTTNQTLPWQMLWPLSAGGRLVVSDSNPSAAGAQLANMLEHHRVTALPVTPSQLASLLPYLDNNTFGSIRYVLCSAEPLQAWLRDRFFTTGHRAALHTVSQLGHVGGALLHWQCRRGEQGHVPDGLPIDNLRAMLRDRWQRPVPADVVGEIWIDDRWGSDGPIATGIRAWRRIDGGFECLPVAVPDHRSLYPASLIEARLQECPEVCWAAVDYRASLDGAMRPIAWIMPAHQNRNAGSDVEWAALSQTLRGHLRRSLPIAAVPATFYAAATLPLDRFGRMDRAGLVAGPAQITPAARAPQGPIEIALLEHWRDTLGLAVTNVNDDFVSAGGQSLTAARLTAWIQERWQVSIGIQHILAGPTIASLAQMIEHARTTHAVQQIKPRRRRPLRAAAANAATEDAVS